MDESITVEVLKEIRNELRSTRETLHADLQDTRERIDRLERRQTESEIRISTEIGAVTSAIVQVRDLLRDVVRTQLHDHERRITALEMKKGA